MVMAVWFWGRRRDENNFFFIVILRFINIISKDFYNINIYIPNLLYEEDS